MVGSERVELEAYHFLVTELNSIRPARSWLSFHPHNSETAAI
jgi:hypothetical protein